MYVCMYVCMHVGIVPALVEDIKAQGHCSGRLGPKSVLTQVCSLEENSISEYVWFCMEQRIH